MMSEDNKRKKPKGRPAEDDELDERFEDEFEEFEDDDNDDVDDDGFEEDFEDEFEDEHLFEEAEFETEGWGIPRDPESVTRLLKSLEGLLPGVLKRAESGSSESADESSGSEGFRARLSERKLPREAVNFILGQVDTTKREFLRIASNEVRVFLESVDLGGEIAKILTTLSFEVRMEVRFIPNDQALKPSARGRMKFKRNRPDKAGKSEHPDDEDSEEGEGGSDDSKGSDARDDSGFEADEPTKPRRWSLRRRGRDEKREGVSEDSPEDEFTKPNE
jgi:hypothetical protein